MNKLTQKGVDLCALSHKMKIQKQAIQNGFQQVVQEEQTVHQAMALGDKGLESLENHKKEVDSQVHHLNTQLEEVDSLLLKKEKDL